MYLKNLQNDIVGKLDVNNNLFNWQKKEYQKI